ncbi:MAG TPA: NnrS family protein [Rubrivivax sp.]|nr:NnrS family protein [Rubrivivax sp.]
MPAPAPRAEETFPPPRWNARLLLTQPHRLCFAAAGLVWAASACFWGLALLLPPPAAAGVPATTLHALAFTLGPMPLFFAGFLFTSAPKWLRRPELATAALAPGVGAVVTGWLLALAIGPWSSVAAGLGLVLCALGWAVLWLQLVSLRRGATRPSRHFDAIATVCGLVVLALAAAALALLRERPDAARELARTAFWAAVLPVFLLASHRLLPFLSHADAPQPDRDDPQRDAWWVPALPLAASVLQALASWSGLDPELAARAWPIHVLLPGAAGLLTLWLALRWASHPATRSPLLHLLLRAFAWSGAAWIALAISALPLLPPSLHAAFEAAALHAMALGFAGGTMLAMVSRLSAAQAGQSQAVDRLARRLEGLLQLLLAARLLAAFVPATAAWALPLAALLWAGLALAWLRRHGGLAGRPRTRPAGAARRKASAPAPDRLSASDRGLGGK